LFAIIQAAGWPIWPLLLASVIAVALIIERAVTLRSSKIIPPTLLEQVLAVYQRQGVNEDVLDKLAQDSPLGEVLAASLRNRKSSRYVMKEAVEEAGRTVAHELERFLTTLGTIATAAPLLGLFGTVIGMIEIFGSQSPTASPSRSTTPRSASASRFPRSSSTATSKTRLTASSSTWSSRPRS
jgi:biopolymer transport protein ExbB